MFRLFTALATAATALTLASAAAAGDWNAQHLPSPAPGYLPKIVDTVAWDVAHLPSPAPGYLPQTVRTRIAFVAVPESRGFVYRDAAIGAAFGALVLAILVGTVLVAVRARRESELAAQRQ